jgi:glycosyltransferase involved in cell wall biosynthesis
MPDWLRRLAHRPEIEIRGRVAALDAVYAEATIALGPLLSGGGTRTKLIEAAAHAVPIVATSRAAAGLDYLENSAWLAEGAEPFANALRSALAAPEERRRRAETARAAAKLRHDRNGIISALAERFAQMLASPAGEASSFGHQ